MVLPTLVDNFPNSFRVSTVMLTEVAVSTVPKEQILQQLVAGQGQLTGVEEHHQQGAQPQGDQKRPP